LRVYAEAIFYNLQKSIPLIEKDFLSSKPSDIIYYILSGTGWELYECDITIERDFSIDGNSNQLEQLRRVQELFGGDLLFNNQKKQVSLLEQRTEDNGVIFAYKKNMEDITKEVDSSELANRVYVYGEDGLNLIDVNDNKSYVTNDISTYVPQGEIYCKEITISYFTNAEDLLVYANYIKLDYAVPKISYQLKAKDLSVLENLDLSYNIGDTITVFDEELDIELLTRIVAIDYNILVPNESEITLSNKVKNIGDEITEFKKHQQRLNKINWLTFMRMIRFYLLTKIRGVGWIQAQNTKFGENVFVGAVGSISLSNPRDFCNVHTLQSLGGSIIGALAHGETFIVQEISLDGEWYKINL
jgi:phage minor structural protein